MYRTIKTLANIISIAKVVSANLFNREFHHTFLLPMYFTIRYTQEPTNPLITTNIFVANETATIP